MSAGGKLQPGQCAQCLRAGTAVLCRECGKGLARRAGQSAAAEVLAAEVSRRLDEDEAERGGLVRAGEYRKLADGLLERTALLAQPLHVRDLMAQALQVTAESAWRKGLEDSCGVLCPRCAAGDAVHRAEQVDEEEARVNPSRGYHHQDLVMNLPDGSVHQCPAGPLHVLLEEVSRG